jgi:hypothetical protein
MRSWRPGRASSSTWSSVATAPSTPTSSTMPAVASPRLQALGPRRHSTTGGAAPHCLWDAHVHRARGVPTLRLRWACGVVLFALVAGHFPFNHKDTGQLVPHDPSM